MACGTPMSVGQICRVTNFGAGRVDIIVCHFSKPLTMSISVLSSYTCISAC